jgi:Raf kinase inhibitor-like YbhB/YbcL family protein
MPRTETILVLSGAFAEAALIPTRHTCDGEDASPELRWEGLPENAASLALICEDPDAPRGTFIHWVIWNLPADAGDLPEGIPTTATLPSGAKQGRNDFGSTGYRGPCPPAGPPHRYYFRLFALDARLRGLGNATAADLRRAMEGHILGAGAIMATYKRKGR